MTFKFGQATDQDHQAFRQWQDTSPAHREAWSRAEAVLGAFRQLPSGIGDEALKTLQRKDRRAALRTLGTLCIAAPAGLLAWRHLAPWRWKADLSTRIGQRKTTVLPDGSRLVLNTDTAVNVAFSPTERRLELMSGEILITTRPDTAQMGRPFLVSTPEGLVQALGTRFSVRLLDEALSRVSVFEHAVRISPANGDPTLLPAGRQVDFGIRQVEPSVAVDASATLWEKGMLLARNMRLDDIVAELARHREGVLRCHPAVADMRLSGSLSLDDTDAGLRLLERSLPLRIERLGHLWVSVSPR